MQNYTVWFKNISHKDIPLVGGKNASLGEMYSRLSKKGVNIPNGFAITVKAYRHFLKINKLEKQLRKIFKSLDVKKIKSLQETGASAREAILNSMFPEDLRKEIIIAYRKLGKSYGKDLDVAVRSSGTAEDLPEASFAGQFETFLNISGEERLLDAVKKCFASIFTDRAISYRQERGYDNLKMGISVGIQKMVRSDLASSGVVFTLDTETGFKGVVLINGSWGLGEMIVKGEVIPDEFYVFKQTLKDGYRPIIQKKLGVKDRKLVYGEGSRLREVRVSQKDRKIFCLSDEEILKLARWSLIIEDHYALAQDIEWAKDGKTKELFIVQSRPETVHTQKKELIYKEYRLLERVQKPIIKGIAVGEKISSGRVRIIRDIKKIADFKKGEILVVPMTNPDWEPLMKLAAGVITDKGGKTSHAAIVSRELGVPAVIGTGAATKILKNGQIVTIDCSQGQSGRVLKGGVKFKIKEYKLENIPKLRTKIMVNIGDPDLAFKHSFLPNQGVGLAREEFIIAGKIGIHPLALAENSEKRKFFIKELSEGIGKIAAAFFPNEVIVRFSDFKTNEYRNLKGGEPFEEREENPMLGFRGAARYLDKKFQPAFEMECQAIKKVREEFGFKNVSVMVPFCRTPKEGKAVIQLIKKFGLTQPLKIYVMCEIPSNVILANEFLEIFDGMSIGSNDLTQLVLGIDRDNAKIAYIGDERQEAVKTMIRQVIKICRQKKKYIGICGQAPSDYPEFAEFLVKEKIDSISLNPDAVIKTILELSKP
ncbi:MAG: phosphoenolpyruvate synthase [Candidatus Nealsonbacteria bacterium]|nr:phosphoenolpyruvate synthase [Candidatus Nealsonbacteria bacterium]